jgi:hypothetical protein
MDQPGSEIRCNIAPYVAYCYTRAEVMTVHISIRDSATICRLYQMGEATVNCRLLSSRAFGREVLLNCAGVSRIPHNSLSIRSSYYFFLKNLFISATRHDVSFHKTKLVTVTAVLTSNITDTQYYRHRQHSTNPDMISVHVMSY